MKTIVNEGLKPLMKTGVVYVLEVGRGLLLGVVISALALALLFMLAPEGGYSAPVTAAAWLSALVFTLAYALAGHQRGLARVLARLTQSHGGLLFDQTLGRFIAATEARKPGAMAALLGTPHKLAEGFHAYLREAALRPKWLQRVALRYVGRVAESVNEGAALPQGVLSHGQLNPQGFKQWAVERMHAQFSPSWQGFAVVAAVHALAVLALGWFGR